jgi:hypothetical protein
MKKNLINKNMKKITAYLVFINIAVLLSSCATVFNGVNPHKTISITGTPEKANVTIDGKLVGQTPLNYELKNRKSKIVQISKDNFEDYNTKIESKLNPIWTAVSVVGGAFPGFLIPTAIDFSNGSVRNITTDKIEYNLKVVAKNEIVKKSEPNLSHTSTIAQHSNDEQVFNPRIRIRTGTREFLLGYKSCVTVTTKSGLKVGSIIAEIQNDYMILAKNNTKIYYKDISKIRMFPIRRWYPIITSVTLISPIFWSASSKSASVSANDCKKQIKEIKVINKYSTYGYGKDNCR